MQFILVGTFALLLLSSILALDVKLDHHWNLWKKLHYKHYSDAEEHSRYDILLLIYILYKP